MAVKFCPLSFFSFYVNKEHAQAGGAHHCVEDACALWDESLEQCGLMTAVEAVSMIAESGAIPGRRQARRNELTSAVRGGLSSSFDKLRKRKKMPTVEQPPSKVEVTHPAIVAKKELQTAAVAVENKTVQTEQKIVNSTIIVKEPVEKNRENNQLLLPITPKIDEVANPAKTLPPTKVELPKTTLPPTKVELPKTEIKEEPLQDFSDLLNPPAVPISELPVVSKPVEDIVTEIPVVEDVVTEDEKPLKSTDDEVKAEWQLPDDLPIPEEFLEKPKTQEEPKAEES